MRPTSLVPPLCSGAPRHPAAPAWQCGLHHSFRLSAQALHGIPLHLHGSAASSQKSQPSHLSHVSCHPHSHHSNLSPLVLLNGRARATKQVQRAIADLPLLMPLCEGKTVSPHLRHSVLRRLLLPACWSACKGDHAERQENASCAQTQCRIILRRTTPQHTALDTTTKSPESRESTTDAQQTHNTHTTDTQQTNNRHTTHTQHTHD